MNEIEAIIKDIRRQAEINNNGPVAMGVHLRTSDAEALTDAYEALERESAEARSTCESCNRARQAAEAEVERLRQQIDTMHRAGLGPSWIENAEVERLTRERDEYRLYHETHLKGGQPAVFGALQDGLAAAIRDSARFQHERDEAQQDARGWQRRVDEAAEALEAAEAREKRLRELVAAQDALLVCYRLRDNRRAGTAIDRVQAARKALNPKPEQEG